MDTTAAASGQRGLLAFHRAIREQLQATALRGLEVAAGVEDVGAARDGDGRLQVVAGYHAHIDTRVVALGDSRRDLGTGDPHGLSYNAELYEQ